MSFRIGEQVRLKVDLSDEGLLAGQTGFVVEARGTEEFEVEFVDADGGYVAATVVERRQVEYVGPPRETDAVVPPGSLDPEYLRYRPPESTELIDAVRAGDRPRAAALIASGADAREMNVYAETPMSIAAEHGDLEMVQVLHAAGATLAFEEAVISGNLELVRWMLDAGEREYIDTPTSEEECTVLMAAAARGDLDMVKLLVANGADANRVDREGERASDKALWRGHEAVADYLASLTSGTG